ncbi:MAG: CRISPR-associated helicase Cas3' [Candidatus Bathyarchaeia archaeon]
MDFIMWDSPNIKESHPDKPLRVHIDEVENLFNRFSDFYSMKQWSRDLVKQIVLHHDDGKLNPAWNIRNKWNPPHSEHSIEYMLQQNLLNKLKEEHKRFYPLIIYLILKHHSSLDDYTGSKSDELKLLCSELRSCLITTIKRDDRIEIADAFGLFKLADSLSASNQADFRPEKPKITENVVKRVISATFRWNEQRSLSKLSNISLLTAYTGWGKTDTSPLFFLGKDVNKIFYIFPTITAINKFYSKLNNILKGMVEKYFFLYEFEIASRFKEYEDNAQDFLSTSFMAKSFLKPIMITTVDQFLLSFLQLGKYYSKRVMFRKSGLIIDEVHLLNPKMLALLLHFLKSFSTLYDLKILFMSATFSEALMRAIKNAMPNLEIMDLSMGYRSLSRIKYSVEPLNCRRTIFDEKDRIISQLISKKKVLVAVNTVSTAISLTKMLEKEAQNILLLHARFMYRDRLKKEEAIENYKNTPHILVTTQVCEVSLDVSYDVLFTELAPISSLVQRFGRVNRHGKRTDMTNVWICKENRSTGSARYPYDDEDLDVAEKILNELYPLENEYKLIEKYNEVESYDALSRRINDAERELDFQALWESDDRTAYFFSFKLDEEEVRKRLLQFRDELTVNVLPAPDCIAGESEDLNVRKELELLLNASSDKSLNRNQRTLVMNQLKGYLVPVPIWWTIILDRNREMESLPIVRFNNRLYTSRYGFVDTEELLNIL